MSKLERSHERSAPFGAAMRYSSNLDRNLNLQLTIEFAESLEFAILMYVYVCIVQEHKGEDSH